MANHVLVDFQLATTSSRPAATTCTSRSPARASTARRRRTPRSAGPPFFLDNLADGSYTVKLDLLGADGKNVPGSWNSTTRSITIAH